MKRLEGLRASIVARSANVLKETGKSNDVAEAVGKSADHFVASLRALRRSRDHTGHVRKNRTKQVLRSFDARFCCVILGWNRKSRISFDAACKLAKELSPFSDCGEPIQFKTADKASGGTRPILSFGPKRRALQLLAKHALKALWMEPELEFSRSGRGRDAAMLKVMAAVGRGGSGWILTADITNCFGSFKEEELCKIIPLPREAIQHCILITKDTSIKSKTTHTSSIAVPSGLPQGSLVSPLVASKLLEPVVSKLHAKVVVSYVDDILVACRTKGEAEAKEQLLRDLLADHPAGPLFMKSSIAQLGCPIDFLGYRLRRKYLAYGGGVRCTPSNKAFALFELRLAKKLDAAPSGKLDEVHDDYIGKWPRAFRLWDRSEAGDILLQCTAHHVLSGIKHKKMQKQK